MQFKVVIPARYASTRLPAKPLLDIAGKPMVVWVAEKAMQSGATDVVIATDHPQILSAAKQYGLNAVMTQESHVSGTDRIAEVSKKMAWHDDDIVVNVQGDEPLIEPALIQEVAAHLQSHPAAVMSTACHAIHDAETFINPNVVKVVLDEHGYALYFSRAPIPYPRDAFKTAAIMPDAMCAYRHIGIYAYRASFLNTYAALAPTPIELYECLEQLRVLSHGYKISASITAYAPLAGVDTEDDLIRVRQFIASSL